MKAINPIALKTPRQREKEQQDAQIRAAFQHYRALGLTKSRIATAIAADGTFGYKSVGGVLASLRRTNTI